MSVAFTALPHGWAGPTPGRAFVWGLSYGALGSLGNATAPQVLFLFLTMQSLGVCGYSRAMCWLEPRLNLPPVSATQRQSRLRLGRWLPEGEEVR